MTGQEKSSIERAADAPLWVGANEAAFGELMDFMPFAYHSLDRDGCILAVNRKWMELLGYRKDEVVGHWLGEFITPDFLPYFEENFPRFKEQGYSDNVEMQLCHKDGHIIYASLSGRILRNKRGEFVATNCIFNDVTLYKETQKQLKQLADRVTAKNREIQTFASIVSHDLRAPLVNIKGFINELRRATSVVKQHAISVMNRLSMDARGQMETALDIDIPEAMDFIDASVLRMDKQIYALLTLSRMQRRPLDVITVNTGEVINACLEMLAHQIQEKSIQITVGDVPDVCADQIAVEKIFGNLLDNAVKYLRPSRPAVIEIGGRPNGEETLFWVRDNGCGVDAKHHERIFDVFQRVGDISASSEGMGLAYIRTLVERHGGRIWCESALEEGACFYFTIGRCETEAAIRSG
ncbi:MAG: PAS domain S-box protein [Spartobacteria bacterium]|nr:PAS domain S-box protein [Spartobacteria bacterium]